MQKKGTPLHPDELVEHHCIVFKNNNITLDHWPFRQPDDDIRTVQVSKSLSTDDSCALVEMARLGLGIIMIDPLLIKAEISNQQLIQILTKWQHPDNQPINLVCLGRNYRSRASTSIWEALSQSLKFDQPTG